MSWNLQFLLHLLPELISAAQATLLLFFPASAAALVGGIGIAAASYLDRGWLHSAARVYTDVLRSLPLILVLYFMFYLVPATGQGLPLAAIGIIALGLQHAAFSGEILRGAFTSIPQAQVESAEALGMGASMIFRLVIFPQGWRKSLPLLRNQLVQVLLDTSLVSAIGYHELMLQGRILVERSASGFEVFLVTGLVYLLLSGGLLLVSREVRD